MKTNSYRLFYLLEACCDEGDTSEYYASIDMLLEAINGLKNPYRIDVKTIEAYAGSEEE
jgi:hypothetical protein